MFIVHLYDSYQLENNLGEREPMEWTDDMCKYADEIFLPSIAGSCGAIANSDRHVIFAPACYEHGLTEYDTFK